ncbi:oligopeptide transporter [Xylariomycetidae sp. FL0641]|nr:oligopeptide transporter [Xylariomycetidae sp. FL0641]
MRIASEEDVANLRHVPEKIPAMAWLLAFTVAAQRFAFFGIAVTWQNYLQNSAGDLHVPGALGLGQSTATIMSNAFSFFSFLTPLPFAIASDTRLGRCTTLLLSLSIFMAGQVVLFVTSLPFAIDHRNSTLGGIVTAMVLMGLGQGGINAVIFSFIADQIPQSALQVVRTKRGELVILDSKLTVQSTFNWFYWMINIATLSILATTFMEKKIGFWAAYLLALSFSGASLVPLIIWRKRLVKVPPEGNVLPHTAKILAVAMRSGFHLSAAEPREQQRLHDRSVPWTSTFIQELRRGLRACRVLVFFVVFYLCFGQSGNNIISQANAMELAGISNDTIQALNPLIYILLNPLIQAWLFPLLARRRVVLGPVARMAVGFLLLAVAMAYAAGVQQLIYRSGPCFSAPLACEDALVAAEAADGAAHYRPNQVSVWLQAPFHLFVAAAEIFGFVALNEFTYAEAPTNMKALVKTFEQFTAAGGSALGLALGPVARDPQMVVVYSALAAAAAVVGAVFYLVVREYDSKWKTDVVEPSSADRQTSVQGEVRGESG